MSKKQRNFFVGLTVIAGLATFAYLILILGEVPQWASRNYKIAVILEDASGLATGSRIRLNGIDVGFVEQLSLTPDLKVYCSCNISGNYDLPANIVASPSQSLLGGTAILLLQAQPTNGEKIASLPRDGSAELIGDSSSVFEEMENTIQSLAKDAQKQLAGLGDATAKITELSQQYIKVGKKLEAQLDPQSQSDIASGKVKANINTTIAEAHKRVAELKDITASIDKIVSDEKLHQRIHNSAENIEVATANAKELTANARDMTADAQKKLDALTNRYIKVADDLSHSLAQANLLMKDARTGKGTMGKLMQDPQLYDSLNASANQLTDMLKEVTLLVEKWKAEGFKFKL